MDLVKTKDGPGSDKKIFGPGPEPEKKIIQARAQVWAYPQLPTGRTIIYSYVSDDYDDGQSELVSKTTFWSNSITNKK